MIDFEPKYPHYEILKQKNKELLNDIISTLHKKDDEIKKLKADKELVGRKLYLANEDITKLKKELDEIRLKHDTLVRSF